MRSGLYFSSRAQGVGKFLAGAAISALGELRGNGIFLFAFSLQMQIHGSRPGKRGASERVSGQRVEIFGEACTLDQRQAVVTDPGGQVGAPVATGPSMRRRDTSQRLPQYKRRECILTDKSMR